MNLSQNVLDLIELILQLIRLHLGPRNCIGLRFGMMSVRIGLFTMLRNFEFLPCSKTDIPLEYKPESFSLLAKNGIYLKIRPLE